MGRQSKRNSQLRSHMAEAAARIMSELGVRDFQLAKQKAASSLGIEDRQQWPTNQEIEQALITYQRLFESAEMPERLRVLRQVAVNAMRFLQEFQPRLVGSVLAGTATRHSNVQLHVFCDTPESIHLYLHNHHIPFESAQKRLRLTLIDNAVFPTIRFIVDQVGVEIIIFGLNDLRQAPLSPIDTKPIRRATLADVELLQISTN